MSNGKPAALFHLSFAVNDLERARAFYGAVLGCSEGRHLPGRADFNFFGHHLVAHLAPDEVIGEQGRKVNEDRKTPLRHFGAIVTLDEFEKIARRLEQHGTEFINRPEVRQKGTVREQMLMTCRDGCGNAIEFKGLRNVADVYAAS